MQLHAATKIILWLLLAITLHWFDVEGLFLLSVILLALMFNCQGNYFLSLLRRTRWLLISLLLIYGYATPGVPFFTSFGNMSPSIQGIESGVIQIWRLCMMLAGLSVVLASTTRDSLLTGLYFIMTRFKCIGVNAERIALRLWLTLNYVSLWQGTRKPVKWSGLIDTVASMPESESVVEFEVVALPRLDKMVLLCSLMLGWILL